MPKFHKVSNKSTSYWTVQAPSKEMNFHHAYICIRKNEQTTLPWSLLTLSHSPRLSRHWVKAVCLSVQGLHLRGQVLLYLLLCPLVPLEHRFSFFTRWTVCGSDSASTDWDCMIAPFKRPCNHNRWQKNTNKLRNLEWILLAMTDRFKRPTSDYWWCKHLPPWRACIRSIYEVCNILFSISY